MTADPEPSSGVNVIGYLESNVGLGEVARRLIRACEHAGIPVSRIVYRRPPSGEGWEEEPVSGEPLFATNVVCLNAEHLQPFLEEVGADLLAGRRTIGVWFWETDIFRELDRRGALYVDEVWVASEYVRQAVAAAVPIPAYVVPLPIEEPPPPQLDRARLELPDRFLFLYVFDFLSAERKNPAAVVDAFTRAFAPDEGPVLVLKSVHGRERKPDLMAGLERLVGGRPDILLRDGRVPAEERDSYIAACDCYVSLHRSEGYGLTIAEAMAYGKPAVATAYSGNLEFMSHENAYLVPYSRVRVPESWWAHEPGAQWAEPDLDAAAAALRRAWERPEDARALGARARADLLERFSLHRTSAFLEARLRDSAAPAAAAAARTAIIDASSSLTRGKAAALEQAEGRGPSRWLRRLLSRALWPYLEEQRRYDTSVVDALNALRLAVDDLGRRVAELETDIASRPERRLIVERRHVADGEQVAGDA